MKIVETDNFDGDYPDESFLNLPPMKREHAVWVANAINDGFGQNHDRYWKVVENDYVLSPGFEP